MARTLPDWLAFIERQHPSAIALGLDRVREVSLRMGLRRPAPRVVTVAGTNGKGSTVAFIEAIARAAGFRTGAYTSPHLVAYNERIRIDGDDAGDAELVAAFQAVDAARGDTSLTYFEYGTLAALWLFSRARLDLAILEVGLGGRLDAVNLVDADVSVITTVDLDHQDWLGADREAIGLEKAGVARAGRPLVLGEDDPPASVLRHAYRIGAPAIRAGSDYLVERRADGWRWREPGFEVDLPMPRLAAPVQLRNAAAAIAALRALDLEIPRQAWGEGVSDARVAGRLQRFMRDGIEVLVDVGHNPQAARALSDALRALPVAGRTHVVYAALADKDAVGVVSALAGQVDGWHLAGLEHAGARGTSVDGLADKLAGTAAASGARHATVAEAMSAALPQLRVGDRLLVFGSFHTAAEALGVLAADPGAPREAIGSSVDPGGGV
ncbi:bifunctional tetrahydrofolate synthase/dihydrofolate synthase [Luteimonas vadosa]